MGTSDLWSIWKRARRVALVCGGVWCVVLGIGVIGVLVAEGSVGRVGTVTLFGLVGMLVLPGLTWVALRLDAKERRRQDESRGRGGAAETLAHPAHGGARRGLAAHRARGVGTIRKAEQAG